MPHQISHKVLAKRQLASEMLAGGMKQCGGPCQRLLPATEENFSPDKRKPDGFRSHCRECRAKTHEVKVEHDTKDALKALMEKMDASVLATLSGAPAGGTNLPHQVQALEELVGLLGGVRGFAMQYVACMQAAPPGSAVRSRMLDKVLQAIQLCSDDAKVSKPRELMTDEELQANVAKRLKSLRVWPETLDGDARETA